MNTGALDSLLELLAMLVTDPRTGALLALLFVAAVIDWRTFRIPNWLTVGGTVLGLACNAAMGSPAQAALLSALAGMALGFAAMLPAYVLRVMGAGDVKLMAMTGAFLGFSATFYALLFTLVAGGVAALAFALWHRALGRMAGNVIGMLQAMLFSVIGGGRPMGRIEHRQLVGRLPYGVCISAGTSVYLIARQLGYA